MAVALCVPSSELAAAALAEPSVAKLEAMELTELALAAPDPVALACPEREPALQ